MNENFNGKLRKNGGYTKTTPKEWTEEEVQYLMQLKESGESLKDIAEKLGRSHVSVQIKYKRLGKKEDSYNDKNRGLKYGANEEFYNLVKPKNILDVYAGNSHWLSLHPETTTNDKDLKFVCEYAMDARRFLAYMEYMQSKYDVVDLDPYGSPYECLDLAMGIAKKGLVVSFGEWGHLRWKRLDWVGPRYGITTLNPDEWESKFIQEVSRVAATHKKKVETVNVIQYQNFIRCYFTLSNLKITSQWEKENGETFDSQNP